jgi:peptidoglycan/xylan/chitin deacetylase (PgdA/CDA1 family)
MALRIDRLATLYVVDTLRRVGSRAKSSIPILMYHSISDENESDVHPYYRTATAPSVFAAQVTSLHQAGFSIIGLHEAIRRFREPEAATNEATINEAAINRVVITFDDGFHNFYTNAFPVLNRYGFTATMYLPTAHIGESRRKFQGKDCLSWGEVRELHQHGISFGSHTVTHPQLHDCDPASIKEEIVGSKRAIEDKIGCDVQSFAYPYAFPEADSGFKRRLRAQLRQAGYENGVCTVIGRPDSASDPFFLKRLPINSDDDSRLFQAKLAGSYDWLAKPQYLLKMAKSWM